MDAMSKSNMTEPILGIAISPAFAQDGIVFAGGNGGLWRSSDHGASWITNHFGSGNNGDPIPVTAVAMSPAFDVDKTVFVAIPGGIGRTHDGGETWTFAKLPLPAPLIATIVCSPAFADDEIAFAGTLEDGMFRTDDGGISWIPWNFGLHDRSILAIVVSPEFHTDDRIYAGTESGIYRSTNRGRSWRPVTATTDCAAVLSLGMTPTGNDTFDLLALTEDRCLLCLRPNEDRTESIDSNGIPENPLRFVSIPSETKPDRLFLAGNCEIVVSDDDGKTWSSGTTLPLDSGEITTFAPPISWNSDQIVFAGTSHGQIHRIHFANKHFGQVVSIETSDLG